MNDRAPGDQDGQLESLRALIAAGVESGPARSLDRRLAADLKDRALGTPP